VLGLRIQGLGVYGLGFGVKGLYSKFYDLEIGVQGLGSRVSGLGFRV